MNGSFDSDLSGWSSTYHGSVIGIAWSALDPHDPTGSGSIQVTSKIDNGGVGGATQCVDVIGVSSLMMRVESVVFPQSFEYLYADPYVRYYDAPACGGTELLTEFPIGSVSMGAGWKQIGGPIAPPPTTQSILIDLGVWKPATALPATVYFDDVFLPESELLTSAAAALVVLAALARWRHGSM